jgi:PAS domain S-box-containing protein
MPALSLSRLRFGTSERMVFATLALVLALWACLALYLDGDRAGARATALRDTTTVAKLVEEHAVSAIRQIDELTYRIKQSYERFGADYEWFDIVTGKRWANAAFFRAFSIIDENGRTIVTSKGTANPPDAIVTRPDFIAQRARDLGFHLCEPRFDATIGRPVIPFTRRINAADGSFAGVVMIELDGDYFASFYASIGLAPKSAVVVTRDDGPILARHPMNDAAVGKVAAKSPMWAALKHSPTGTYDARSIVDFVERLYAYRANGEYAFIVIVGFAQDEILAAWERRAEGSIAALFAISAATLLGCAILVRQFRRREASEAQYRAIVDSAVDGIVTTDRAGIIRSLNHAAEALFGYPRDEAIGRHLSLIFLGARQGEGAWAPTASGAALGHDGTVRSKGGLDRPVEVTVARWSADGEPYSTGIVRDVTDRRRIEEELRAAKDAAEQASRAKSAFLANMSHELRTPLNAVIGFADVIGTQLLGPVGNTRYIEYAHDIRSSGEHLLQLINDILDLSKAEAGQLTLHEGLVDVGAVVETCRRMLGPSIDERRVAVRVSVASDARYLRGDETRLRQIVLNLLSNAVKFTPEGGHVVLAARAEEAATVLAVTDTGIGIAPENLARVMEPFGQIESALSRSMPGTGLGLPLTKRLVELHGGTLDLASEPGAGTTVTLRFPRERALRQVA